MNDGSVVVIARDESHLELQYRLECKSCNLPVAYRFHPDLRDCHYLYIMEDGLSDDPVHFQKKIRKLQEVIASTKDISHKDLGFTKI